MDLDFSSGAEAGEWYAPDFKGNLSLPAEQRAECFCTPINGREFSKLKRGVLAAGTKGRDAKSLVSSVATFEERLKREIVSKHVTQIRRWFAKDEAGNKAEVTSIDALLDMVATKSRRARDADELLDELYSRIIGESTLPEGLEGE